MSPTHCNKCNMRNKSGVVLILVLFVLEICILYENKNKIFLKIKKL